MSGARLVMNVVVFQTAWLCAVAGAGAGLFWLGPVAALVAVVAHLSLAGRPLREACTLLGVTALGASLDVTAAKLGFIEYRGGLATLGGAPLWIVTLWLAFATTLNASLHRLRTHPAIAFGLGAIGGPLSYLGAERLGAVALVDPVGSIATLALGYGLLLPVCFWTASRLDGWSAAAAERNHD